MKISKTEKIINNVPMAVPLSTQTIHMLRLKNILSKYYYNKNRNELALKQHNNINEKWGGILRIEGKLRTSNKKFKEKYKLRMKLTPLENLK